MYHKDTNLDSRKLDWMQLHRRDELCQIMHDNGSFISLPPLGSKMNTVTVYAENRVNAERTLRSINFLVSKQTNKQGPTYSMPPLSLFSP